MGEFGVDAGAAQEEQLFHPGVPTPRRLDQIVLDGEIVEEEGDRLPAVGENAANLGRGDEDVLGPFPLIKFADGDGVQEVQLGARPAQEPGEAELLEPAPKGAAHHAAMAGDINARVTWNSHRSKT